MSSSLINTMTSDQWKNLREAAGIKKTPWFLPGSTSVASKLTDWQNARRNVAPVRKKLEGPGYKFDPNDGPPLKGVCDTLRNLTRALNDMLDKARKHRPANNDESAALTLFTVKIQQMVNEAQAKQRKWDTAYAGWQKKNLADLKNALGEIAV